MKVGKKLKAAHKGQAVIYVWCVLLKEKAVSLANISSLLNHFWVNKLWHRNVMAISMRTGNKITR